MLGEEVSPHRERGGPVSEHDGDVDDERVVDVDEERQLLLAGQRQHVHALQLQRQPHVPATSAGRRSSALAMRVTGRSSATKEPCASADCFNRFANSCSIDSRPQSWSGAAFLHNKRQREGLIIEAGQAKKICAP